MGKWIQAFDSYLTVVDREARCRYPLPLRYGTRIAYNSNRIGFAFVYPVFPLCIIRAAVNEVCLIRLDTTTCEGDG